MFDRQRDVWKLAVAMVLLLAGESYGSKESPFRFLTQSGYKDSQIDEKTWEVDYSGGDYNFVYNSAVRRSAEIAKREGFPYFSVVKVKDALTPIYSQSRYVGSQVYITLRMRGWHAYEERCQGDKMVRSPLRCDLYNTDKTLASYE